MNVTRALAPAAEIQKTDFRLVDSFRISQKEILDVYVLAERQQLCAHLHLTFSIGELSKVGERTRCLEYWSHVRAGASIKNAPRNRTLSNQFLAFLCSLSVSLPRHEFFACQCAARTRCVSCFCTANICARHEQKLFLGHPQPERLYYVLKAPE